MLRALGTRPGQIARLVMLETVLLAVAATALGMGVGAAAIWLMRNGVPLGARIEFGGVVLDSMRARFSARALGLTPLLMLAAGLLAGLPPALRAARIVPVAALREE
ncbi:MAG: FtsX-like permease family protein [Kiritimatiellaeota bacterium]|nr:FtsX-like permease family protein [Kiritimatiellota bacterium]